MTSVNDQGRMMLYFYQPFAPRQVVAHGPEGRWAHGMSSGYEITLVQGEQTLRLAGSASPPALSSGERAAALRRLDEDAARAGVRASQLPYGVPDSKPPLQAIFFDSQGRLWVERSQPDGTPRVADVWDPGGTLATLAQRPEDVTLAFPGWVGVWKLKTGSSHRCDRGTLPSANGRCADRFDSRDSTRSSRARSSAFSSSSARIRASCTDVRRSSA